MAKNLYVGNLSYSVTDDDLNQLFAQFGQVDSARVIMDRDSGRSKGFGFVEMADDNEAQAAIDALNGKDNNGRVINVNEAKPRTENNDRGGFGGGRPRGDRGGKRF
ncbi:MAG: RNA-binding protein [Oligosphaeraceae bacterium]|nr:RNA-binding protein [Oligosphaeraceae bacterium]